MAAGAEIPDRRLALMFACAQPAIEAGFRALLMLQVVDGLDAKDRLGLKRDPAVRRFLQQRQAALPN